ASLIGELAVKLQAIYDLQANSRTFVDLVELAKELGIMNETQTSYYERMVSQGGISTDLLYSFLEPILRVNYLQNSNVQAFAGSVGTAGMVYSFGGVEEGCEKIVSKAIASSGANLHLESRVLRIIKEKQHMTLIVEECKGKN